MAERCPTGRRTVHAAPLPAITGGGAAFYKRVLRKGPVPSGYFSARAETDLARATYHAVCKFAAGCCGKGAPIFESALPAASQEAEDQTPLQGVSAGVARSAFPSQAKAPATRPKPKPCSRRLPFTLCIRRSARGREPPFRPAGEINFGSSGIP